mgnify:CR=1 FL=1
MDMRGYQRYREDSLNTMTQGELLLLLYDELIKRLTQAELSLGQENYEVFEGASAAVSISSIIWTTPLTASSPSAPI